MAGLYREDCRIPLAQPPLRSGFQRAVPKLNSFPNHRASWAGPQVRLGHFLLSGTSASASTWLGPPWAGRAKPWEGPKRNGIELDEPIEPGSPVHAGTFWG